MAVMHNQCAVECTRFDLIVLNLNLTPKPKPHSYTLNQDCKSEHKSFENLKKVKKKWSLDKRNH